MFPLTRHVPTLVSRLGFTLTSDQTNHKSKAALASCVSVMFVAVSAASH